MPALLRRPGFWLVLLVVLVVGAFGATLTHKGKARQAAESAARAAPTTPYDAVAEGKADIEGGIIQIASRTAGVVREVEVLEGDQVTRNQVLARQEDDAQRLAVETAEANLKALQAQVQQQQVQLRYYTIAAPTAGVVGDIPVRQGMQVTTSTLLTTVDQNETLEVYVSVPLERAGDLKLGLPIQILSSDGGQRLATTAVNFISPHVDDQTQSVLVKGAVRNPDLTLRASQFVRARLVWKTTSGLVIPVTAVLRISGQYFAFVAEDANGKLVARQRAVKLGSIVGDNYAVLDGIKPNERVVVSGVQKLADGMPIAPAP